MKINNIFLFAAMAATALFSSCSDKDVTATPGEWNAQEGYANVYFQKSSVTESIDPADPTVYTFEVYRHVQHKYTYGKDDDGNDVVVTDEIITPLPAVTVKPTVLVNTDDVFTVSDASFAAGDTVTTFTASFPNAEIGTQYTLQVTFNDPSAASLYSADVTSTYKVTRVKWNLLGDGTYYDGAYFGMSGNVEIYQRDDDNSYFRIYHPYKDILAAYEAAGYGDRLSGDESEYFDIKLLKKNEVVEGVTIEDNGIVDWYRICTGYINTSYNATIWQLSAKNFSSRCDYDHLKYNKVVEYLADGKTPGKIQLGSMPYMFGVGGWDYTQPSTEADAIIITFPGYVEEYTANIGDYDWEPVYTGQFTSGKLGASKEAVLYKGVAKADVEAENAGCYKRDSLERGIPYYIESPYADGKNIYFYAKGDAISLPAEYATEDGELVSFDLQETGMEAVGDAVYAKINTGKSSFSDSEVSLNITFTNEDNSIEYGTTDEVMANIKWIKVGTGTYTYAVMFNEPMADPGYEIYKREDKPDTYKIPDWFYGGDFVFTWNQTTNKCTVPISFSGYVHSQVGNIYVGDWVYFYQELAGRTLSYDDYPCYYDPATKTFHFTLLYLSAEGRGWGLSSPTEETLEVTWDAASSAAKRAAKKNSFGFFNFKSPKKLNGAKSPFANGKKVQATRKSNSKIGQPKGHGPIQSKEEVAID